MGRKDFRVHLLRNMSWTVEDPEKAVFYMAPGLGGAAKSAGPGLHGRLIEDG